MFEQLKYVNHNGEILNFGEDGLYVNLHELHDFAWKVVSIGEQIGGFSREMQTRTIPVRIGCASKAEGIAKRNALFEIPEKDVLSEQYGKLWINGYYCECFVTASSKSYYSTDGRFLSADLTITTDRPYWIKESVASFRKTTEIQTEIGYDLDYPYDFTHDYLAVLYRKNVLENTAFYDTNFRMIIYGAVVNPTIYIGGHLYQVNALVENGEYLTIDSNTKEIFVTKLDGSIENVFDLRNRDSYIFQPLPAQESVVMWDNTFDFDIYLLDERSEPKWS